MSAFGYTMVGWIGALLFVAFMSWATDGGPGYYYGYKQGQIDALTGKVEYELRTKTDKTVVWVKKGEKE